MPELIGSTIDPSLFVQDYSGFARGAQMNAASYQGSFNQIADSIGDYAKEQKEEKNQLKASQAQIDAAITLFPDQAPYLSKIANELKDENKPLSERAAVGVGIAEMINMGVGQARYQTEQMWKQKDYEFQQRDQKIKEQESALGRHMQELQIDSAENSLASLETDEKTKATIGPALLDSVLAMAPAGISDGVRDSLAKGEYTDEEKYSLANSITALIPKAQRQKAPSVQDVSVPGGTQKMQWDDLTGKWVPMDIANPESFTPPAPRSGDPTNPDLPIFTPADATDDQLGMVLPPLNPQQAAMQARPGFTPTPTDPNAAIQAEKQKAEAAAINERKAASVAKSQDLISRLDALQKHDGFNALFGASIPFEKNIPGTDAADAYAIFSQIEGKGFIEAIQDMKGMGALSNAEGQKASAAFLGMSTNMSEAAAKLRIKELKELVAKGIERASTGNLVSPDGASSGLVPNADPFSDASAKLRGLIQPR